jgi:hypothetical protein
MSFDGMSVKHGFHIISTGCLLKIAVLQSMQLHSDDSFPPLYSRVLQLSTDDCISFFGVQRKVLFVRENILFSAMIEIV